MANTTSGRTHKIWRDGQLVGWEDATIHVMSHVVHYGSSVFEGIRCYETPSGPAVFRLRDHMRRLLDSCKIYRIPITHSLDEASLLSDRIGVMSARPGVFIDVVETGSEPVR